jgi:FkbH-like protein
LVIWDLDDTLWNGTLSEGDITLTPESDGAVRELARRGIVSSICSRNDFARAKEVLSRAGLWDYFIFPSIDWNPKGPRIQALIGQSQLRPETVLFIDDNPSNLEEARHFNPAIQTAGVDIIAGMLENSAFLGAPDPDLGRLKQYKALELRKSEYAIAGGELGDFLRQSNIRVEILYDLDEQLDRITELVNRTNQLNFTKNRLSDDPGQARSELSALLRSHEIQAGLVRVTDRYGDHGYAGFYMLRNGRELLHFCFSCRILGMGVETWLYRKLGRPRLAIRPEVASDPTTDTTSVDWIALMDGENEGPRAAARPGVAPPGFARSGFARSGFDWVAARGGCDLQAVSHYFKLKSDDIVGEFNVGRRDFDARVDHSMFLRYAIDGLPADAVRESAKIGYQPEDFRTSITHARPGKGLIILSFWADVSYALYRHRRLRFLVPFAVSGRSNHSLDARSATPAELPEAFRTPWFSAALATLRSDYDYLGTIPEDLFKENLEVALRALPTGARAVILQGNIRLQERREGALVTHTSSDTQKFNGWIREVVGAFPNVAAIDIRDVIRTEDEVPEWSHFHRMVYFRLYRRICELWD